MSLKQGTRVLTDGVTPAVAEITGLSRTTIRRGMAELRRGVGSSARRIRKPGGGRKLVEKKSLGW